MRRMTKHLGTAAFLFVGALAFAVPAIAASGSERECEADGGTYTKDGPDAICVYPEENVGNAPEHSNSQTTQTTGTGQGNLDNKTETECEGPLGQCK